MSTVSDRRPAGAGPIRLVVFDCDGTLVDSQRLIVACMSEAFLAEGLAPPTPDAIRRIVGLSLVLATATLLDGEDEALALRIAEAYQRAFRERHDRGGIYEPLFPGALELLDELRAQGLALGIATGKRMRGLRLVLERHRMIERFVTLQTADHHPSKPHPAMLEAAMAETGCAAEETILVGDTTFDILMARAAGAVPIGVAWGNHPSEELADAGAVRVMRRFDELLELL